MLRFNSAKAGRIRLNNNMRCFEMGTYSTNGASHVGVKQ